MTVIYKGKGPPTDPSSWRGIGKKSCVYKMLSSLLVSRLVPYLEHKSVLPDEQYGFRRGRSTIDAVRVLTSKVERTLRRKGQFLYAVFVDFKAAFDSGSRTIALERLAETGIPANIMALLSNILQANMIQLDDGICLRSGLTQTNGFTQGDNLSPLLFTCLIADLPARVKDRHRNVELALFADDLVAFSTSRFHLQQSLHTLDDYVREVGLQINLKKTEAMKFRRGGGLARDDVLKIGGQEIQFVNRFTYLGVTLSLNGRSFSAHVMDRFGRALAASHNIKNPASLSIETALKLFHMKVSPTASYGIGFCWEKLTAPDFALLDRIKPAFLKRVLGLHRSTLNRIVYLLVGTPLYVEDLARQLGLRETEAYKVFLQSYETKLAAVDHGLYYTIGMTSEAWRGANQPNRHLVARMAAHGFHSKLCKKRNCTEPDEGCVCRRCKLACPRYHAAQCTMVDSIASLARN